MSRSASIGRDAAGLTAASDTISAAGAAGPLLDRATVEDTALTLLAQALLTTAGTRTESQGSHVRTDFPDTDDVHQRDSLLVEYEDAPDIHGTDRSRLRVRTTHDDRTRDRYAR